MDDDTLTVGEGVEGGEHSSSEDQDAAESSSAGNGMGSDTDNMTVESRGDGGSETHPQGSLQAAAVSHLGRQDTQDAALPSPPFQAALSEVGLTFIFNKLKQCKHLGTESGRTM